MNYFSISIFNRGLGDNIMAYQYYKSLSIYCKNNNCLSLVYVKSDLELEINRLLKFENILFKKIGYSPKLDLFSNFNPFIDKLIFLLDIIFFKKSKYLIFLDSSKSKIINLISFFYKSSFIIGSSKVLKNSFNININLDENMHLSESLIKFLPPEVDKINKDLSINSEFSYIKKNIIMDNYIVFAPGSGELEKHKRWPYENYSILSNLLIKNDINIVVIGSINEKHLIKKISNSSKNIKLSQFVPNNLKDSLSLFKFAKLVVGGDSGNLHLASTVNENILAIWGPTNKYKTSPKTKKIKFIDLNLPCSPCYTKYRTGCGNNICLKNISPNLIYENILEVI